MDDMDFIIGDLNSNDVDRVLSACGRILVLNVQYGILDDAKSAWFSENLLLCQEIFSALQEYNGFDIPVVGMAVPQLQPMITLLKKIGMHDAFVNDVMEFRKCHYRSPFSSMYADWLRKHMVTITPELRMAALEIVGVVRKKQTHPHIRRVKIAAGTEENPKEDGKG